MKGRDPQKWGINYTGGFFDSLGRNHASHMTIWKSNPRFFEVSETEVYGRYVALAQNTVPLHDKYGIHPIEFLECLR